jgi:putative flavoprotein involved in K+ transport
MTDNIEKQKWGTIVIGAGQAGLAAGYYLNQFRKDFLILDGGKYLGDSWRNRWDSLQLFTPAQYDSLPGFSFPAKRGSYPTKSEMADYLEKYAQKYALPVRLNTRVTSLRRTSSGYEIETSTGKLQAEHIIVATGTNPDPYIPDFAKDLDEDIFQIHSSLYKNPGSLPFPDTLVVGAGTSGVEIAIELSASRPTIISGHPTPHIPDPLFRYAGGLYWWFINHILTIRTPIGRKVKGKIIGGGGPLIRISFKDLLAAGVKSYPRLIGVQNGQPQVQDGHVLPVSSIVWATGFKPDFSWIHLDITDETGWPRQNRGISEKYKNLYFVGMLFQYGLTSGLVGGVGRDAAFIVDHLQKNKH